MSNLVPLIAALLQFALAQQQLPPAVPPFRLGAADFVQSGTGVSNVAWRADGEGGLDVTPVPCEGRYVLSFIDRKPALFNVKSVHTFLQRVEMSGHVFESDNLDPLVFRVDAEGYTWVRGKGNVTIPAGAAVQSRGVTVLPDQRTFLLPPGRQSPDLAVAATIASGQRITICGRQLQLLGMSRAESGESIHVRLALGFQPLPAPAATRVNIALIDSTGRRFKPQEGTTALTWDNIAMESGIPFQVPKGATPAVLELEGIRFQLNPNK